MKNQVLTRMQGSFSKVGFVLKKHSPEILMAAGLIGVVASTVVACKETTKISTILREKNEDVERIHECAEDGFCLDISGQKIDYTKEDLQKDLTITYVNVGKKFVKLYAPAFIIGTLALSCILASNNVLRKRNVALTAAYATVNGSFKEYRKRVAERYGKEAEREIRYNIKARQIETTTTDEDGKEKKTTETVNVAELDAYDDYVCVFDEHSPEWVSDTVSNLSFLSIRQNFANERLRASGHIFLNEVYDMLGLPRTKMGQVVGWLYQPDDPEYKGDNYVDFGVSEINVADIDGYSKSILLEFNADGNILDLAYPRK